MFNSAMPAVLWALVVPPLALGQVMRTPLPRAALERPVILKDTRPAGPAPGMIYGTALSTTKARITWSTVPAANGYQLSRSGGGSSGMTLIQSVAATPGLVLAVDPTQYGKPVISPIPIKWGGTPNTTPPIRYLDSGRTPKASYTYMVVATYPDTGQYRSGSSEPAVLAMPPGLPPAWITATASLGTTVTLNWQPAPDASGYQV